MDVVSTVLTLDVLLVTSCLSSRETDGRCENVGTKIIDIREVPLARLVIGESQTRVRQVDKDIDELAESIRIHGLLEPIVVCPADGEDGYFEVVTGQRRFLAYRQLGRPSILAVIIKEPADTETAKALSLTENMIRRDLDSKDTIDACAALYKKYGSARAVADETGIPYAKVLKYLKYDRLHPAMRSKVDVGELALDIALKAQDTVADVNGDADPAEATDLAEALSTMTGAERQQILRAKRREPEIPVRTLLEKFWTSHEKNRQIVVTLPTGLHKALQAYARKLQMTQDVAAAHLLAASLEGKY